MAAASSGIQLASFGNMVAVAAGVAGAIYGYTQADIYAQLSPELAGVSPLQGAGIFAIAGFILGRLAGFVLKTVLQIVIFFGIIILLICIFREPIRDRVGFDPAAFLERYFGMAIERVRGSDT
ncbi:MAG: hypothetical protein AAFX03_11910 [Pseudomonadota bacterium]